MDRNTESSPNCASVLSSLSARRAWIEIQLQVLTTQQEEVALRKESVDRNLTVRTRPRPHNWSLSARRAWIEIWKDAISSRDSSVALRKESVDRNYPASCYNAYILMSLSARRAWIEIARNPEGFRNVLGRSPQGERG